MLLRLLFALALGLTATLARAADFTAPLPPALPWHGASEKLVVRAGDPWITPAEAGNFATTPSYAETRAWAERLVAASPLLKFMVFGRSAQGRELFAILASKPGAAPKPLLLAQGGIHAGEIDGKDAGLMLLRDIALRGKAGLLDKADFLFVPIFNVDGHERSGPYNRPNQRGPGNQGWRTTAQNLNLNRDYLKADTPEMAAMIGLINRYDPSLYLDLHVTDGIDYQYDITFTFNGWDGRYALSPASGRWLDQVYRPAVMEALARAGHIPGLAIQAGNDRKPDESIDYSYTPGRFSHGYGDLRRLPAVLVEDHSLKPYRQRVLGDYVLLEASLRLVGDSGPALTQAIAADRADRPRDVPVSWRPLKDPIGSIDFLGIAHESHLSPASGAEEVRWLGRPVRQRMTVTGNEPATRAILPVAWWVPATKPELIARLRLHGVRVETLDAPRTLEVEMLRLPEPRPGTLNEGHVEIGPLDGKAEMRRETFPPGSVRVPADQSLGLLAAALIEPGSSESLLAWGFFPEIFQRTEYIEGYAVAPLADAMLARDPELKRAFEARLAADPAFAKDPDARLGWFYARTPYYDDRYLLYPVGREISRR